MARVAPRGAAAVRTQQLVQNQKVWHTGGSLRRSRLAAARFGGGLVICIKIRNGRSGTAVPIGLCAPGAGPFAFCRAKGARSYAGPHWQVCGICGAMPAAPKTAHYTARSSWMAYVVCGRTASIRAQFQVNCNMRRTAGCWRVRGVFCRGIGHKFDHARGGRNAHFCKHARIFTIPNSAANSRLNLAIWSDCKYSP